jgi:hypothetical protein
VIIERELWRKLAPVLVIVLTVASTVAAAVPIGGGALSVAGQALASAAYQAGEAAAMDGLIAEVKDLEQEDAKAAKSTAKQADDLSSGQFIQKQGPALRAFSEWLQQKDKGARFYMGLTDVFLPTGEVCWLSAPCSQGHDRQGAASSIHLRGREGEVRASACSSSCSRGAQAPSSRPREGGQLRLRVVIVCIRVQYCKVVRIARMKIHQAKCEV